MGKTDMIENQLFELLEILGYEVYKQGSFTTTEEYQDNFFTVWNDDTEEKGHYDNQEQNCIWYFTVNFYSVDPLLPTTILLKAKKLLEENDWIVPGKGKDVYSDSKNHSGRSMEIMFMEKGGKQDV